MRLVVVLSLLAGCWSGDVRTAPSIAIAPASLETKAAHATARSRLDVTSPNVPPVAIALLPVASGGASTDGLTATFEHALRERIHANRARFTETSPDQPPGPCAATAIPCLQREADKLGAELVLGGYVHQMSWERAPTFELRLFRAHATAPERLAKVTVAPTETLDEAAARAFEEVTRATAYFVITANVPTGTVKLDGETRAWITDKPARILLLDNAQHIVEISAPGHRRAVRAIRALPGDTAIEAVLAPE